MKKANLLVGIFNATERTCLCQWYTVLRGPCMSDASCYVGVCTFVVVYVCRYMYIWALIYIYIHTCISCIWILDACHCTWQIKTQYTTSAQELGKHLMNLFKVVSRYIHHSRMTAPGNHIRPSPTVHISLFAPCHHVKSLEGFPMIQENRKLDHTGSALMPWKVGDASFTAGVGQLDGLEDFINQHL